MCDTSSSGVELRNLLKDERELSEEAQAICDLLNEYRLPRAIVHLGRDRFIAWNVSFQERTGYTAEQLHFAHLKDLVAFSEPGAELAEDALQPTPGVHLVRCTTRCSGQEHFATGYAARRDDEFVLLMLDVINPSTGAIEDARLFGRGGGAKPNLETFS